MLAAVFKAPGSPLAIESLEDPVPGPGEVVIRVGRCGICASDLHLTEAIAPDQPPLHPFLEAMRRRFGPGSVLGHEYSGEVVALGAGVERLRVGDRITALPFGGCGRCEACLAGQVTWCPERRSMQGGYGQYTRVSERSAIRLPATLSLADGALVEPLAVGHQAAALAAIEPGARVLVLGSGPMGLASLFWARRMGAGRIVATARTPRHAAIARALGADEFLLHGADLPDRAAQALRGPAQVVFECTGASGQMQLAMDCAAPRGTVLLVGLCATPESISPVVGLARALTLRFVMAYTVPDFRASVEALEGGALEPRTMITQTVSLDEAPGYFEALRGPTHHCKIHIDPSR